MAKKIISITPLLFACLFLAGRAAGGITDEHLGHKSEGGSGEPAIPYFVPFASTPEEVEHDCSRMNRLFGRAIENIAKQKPKRATFESTVVALDMALQQLGELASPMAVLREVGQTQELKDAAGGCVEEIEKFSAEQFNRADLYRVFEPFIPADPQRRPTDEATNILIKLFADRFRDSGVFLPEDEKAQHVADIARLAAIETEYKNRAAEPKFFPLKKEWLKGMDADYVKELYIDDGERKGLFVELKRNPYRRFMYGCPSDEGRREVYAAYWKVGGRENLDLLEESIQTRARLAKRLGYPNYAALVLESRMAGNPETVRKFLDDFGRVVGQKRDRELARMREIKCGPNPAPTCRIEAHDWRYFSEIYKQTDFGSREEELRKYLFGDRVVNVVFETLSRSFGWRFQNGGNVPMPQPWADPERLGFFRVYEGNTFLGYLYTDLYERELKVPGAFMQGLRAGLIGKRKSDPLVLIDGAFPAPKEGGVAATVSFEEMQTMFHELGHATHGMLGTAPYAELSGTNVMHDFVEVPSTILENWAWQPEVLKKINPDIPDELIQAKIRSRHADAGLFWARQLLYAKAALEFHMQPERDATEIFNEIHDQVRGFDAPEGTYGNANVTHLVSGPYSVGYFSYLWSFAIAEDLFAQIRKSGLDDPTTLKKYVDEILRPGGTRDPTTSIRAFLGRDWNLKSLAEGLGGRM